jgi:predicted GNAT superfamily acetyltransferase
MNQTALHILETPEEFVAVEDLQRLVWPGNETEIVPGHLLLTAAHNGGVAIGAYDGERLVGFAFGFVGLYDTPDGPRPKHCSHMLGVHPDYRDQGLGYLLKRAQWQMVRRQGLDRITWTYDPLLSRNAHLNIARLGAVCNTYQCEAYGEMRDTLNAGLPSDRFQVDWWVNSSRVTRRLSKRARRPLTLQDFLKAATPLINPAGFDAAGLPHPELDFDLQVLSSEDPQELYPLLLLEIPADFLAIKGANPPLALEWRMHSRQLLETLFDLGYLVTDFVHLPGTQPRSYYVLSYGESTL